MTSTEKSSQLIAFYSSQSPFRIITYFGIFSFSHFRAAIQAISSYLEAFQKIADAATNSKGMLAEAARLLLLVVVHVDPFRGEQFLAHFFSSLLVDWEKVASRKKIT